ncbi:hypothetical protein RI129_001742 [Pyrocoelia pectoralis]|uniref:G-protein coupled receptors family 2 profile 2 domain-containing protein n=1 Tax=Pyrocoelia pectoralis TaxID=417401 RepID=A0AAN7VY84_9COLE
MIISSIIVLICHIIETTADSTVAYRHYYTGGSDVASANQFLMHYLNNIKNLQSLNTANDSNLDSALSVIAPNNQGVPYIDSDNKHPNIPGFKAVPVWDTIESDPSNNTSQAFPLEIELNSHSNLELDDVTTNQSTTVVYSHNNLQWQDVRADQSSNIGSAIPLSDQSTTTNDYENFPQCPDGLILHQTLDKKISCYKIVDATTFPPPCPYPLNIDYYFFRNTYHVQLTNKIVWAFVQKNIYNGAYEWINFAHNNSIISTPRNSQSKKNCMVINGTDLIAVSCKEKFSGICIYNFDYSIQNSYCKRKLDENCFSSTLGVINKCFCIKLEDSQNQSRSLFCDKLAELRDPYQNQIVTKNLQRNQYCWLGIRGYHWISDNSLIRYPYWSTDINVNKNYGAIGNDGWILEDDKRLSCAICEKNVSGYNGVRLNLTHNLTNNYIQLDIYNPIETYLGVMCFTGNETQFINLTMSRREHEVVHLWSYEKVKEDGWCKALQLPNMDIVFSNQIKGNMNVGNIFSAIWSIPITQWDNQRNSCPPVKHEIVKYNNLVSVSTVGERNKIEIVCHLHTIPSSYTIVEEYAVLKEAVTFSNFTCENLGSVDVCLPSETTSRSKTLHWPQTQIGCTVVAQELCFQRSDLPVTRTCLGDEITGAKWLPVNGSCAEVSLPPTTIYLNKLLRESPSNASKDLLRLTENETNLDTYQIHLVSKILSNMATRDNVSVKDTVSTISNIMKIGLENLKNSQAFLNSTDTILWSLDDILLHLDTDSYGYVSEGSEMLLIQVTNLVKTDIKGFKLQTSDARSFDATKLEPLHHYPSGNELEENLDLALIIPEGLREEIMQCTGSKETPNVITSMFHNDALFNEKENITGRCDGKVISVLLPGFNCNFTSPLKVIFKASSESNTEIKCASWSYGTNKLKQSVHGRWSVETKPKSVGNSSLYKLCEFSHTTHFALLVLGQNTSISQEHIKALDIITAIGSGLSILGLIAIFVTAILFKSYRKTNGVVINFSLAMTAQIVFLFIAGSAGDNLTMCTIFGALLHYAVLSQFFWMLTIALLQYQRYVIIFSSPPTHLVAKSCLFAWGVPLIPIITIVSISTDNYGKNSYGLCYALGHYFTFAVIVPVSLITIVNLLIFIRIMISIASSRRIKVHQDRARASALQLRLAFMLFFLLGLTWGFGLFITIGGGVVYSYLFCLTATLQGFVLFLFFIVLNEKTRSLWISITRCWRKSDDYDVNRDSASSIMMRRNQAASTNSSNDSTTNDILRKLKNRNNSDF